MLSQDLVAVQSGLSSATQISHLLQEDKDPWMQDNYPILHGTLPYRSHQVYLGCSSLWYYNLCSNHLHILTSNSRVFLQRDLFLCGQITPSQPNLSCWSSNSAKEMGASSTHAEDSSGKDIISKYLQTERMNEKGFGLPLLAEG